MRFLIAFVAVLGYASASVISPLILGVNPGDAQAAAINTAVHIQDTSRAIGEGQARAAEAAIQYNTEAVRQVAETNRDLNQNAYWNSLAAGQNYVAAAQSQAAAIDGAAAAVRATQLGVAAPWGVAPLGLGVAGLGVHGLGIQGLGVHGLGVQGLGVHGLGVHGLGLRAW